MDLKLLLPMKMTVILLLAVCLQVCGRSNAQGVTLSVKNKGLSFIFKEIRKQTGYQFFYNDRMLSGLQPVTLEVKNMSLEGVLKICFANQPLDFEIIEKTIIVKDKEVGVRNKIPDTIAGITATIHGKVLLAGNTPAAGATVSLKGKAGKLTRGFTTNESGEFSINASPGDVLVISYIGYASQEIKVRDNNDLTIVLQPDSNKAETEIVVTALGIKRASKSLTYNVQEVKREELTRVPDPSFVNALDGKVAGVTINASSSGIGGSTRVVMRGTKGLNSTDNNNALYVLDGIPLPNIFSISQAANQYGGGDNGDGISMFNPEDVDNLTVLTGPAAAALYGGNAANGVVSVNTRKGTNDGNTRISLSNGTEFYSPFVMPQFQSTYGTSVPGAFDSWGAKLAKPSTYNPKDFFQTGTNIFNNFSLATGSGKNQTYFSVATDNARGIIPNNTFSRYNFTLRNTSNYLDGKLTLDLTAMYIKLNNQNMISQGQYYNPLVPIYLFPRGDDIDNYKVFEQYNPSRTFNTQFWPYGDQGLTMQNPYWIINRNLNTNSKDRYLLGINLKYNLFSWLNVTGRVREDNMLNVNEQKYYASTFSLLSDKSDNGFYQRTNETTNYTYMDLIAEGNKQIRSFNVRAHLGGSFVDQRHSLTGYGAGLAKVPNLFNFDNTLPRQAIQDPNVEQVPPHYRDQAVFGDAEVSYKNFLTLSASERGELSSTLPDKWFYYPSVGLSAVISDMVTFPQHIISFLKLRGSYSEVGNAPPPFVNSPASYPVTPSGVTIDPNLPFPNLQPERTKSVEAGIDARLLKNIVTLSVTLYNSNTFNQLFEFQGPAGSGYANYFVNAGKVNNKGIEAALGANVKMGPVNWNSSVTYTLNRNKIVLMVENAPSPVDGSLITENSLARASYANNFVKKGYAIGNLYVNSIEQDDYTGFFHIDPNSGRLFIDNKNLINAGNSDPDFSIGFRNNFSFKGFDLGFLVNGRFGGVCISETQAVMDSYGASLASAKARDNGGVLVNGGKMDAQSYYTQVGGGTGVLSQYVYSATNVRLREASLGYTIPAKVLNNKIQSLTLSLIGRNLFMFYNKAPFDPQSTASTGTFYQGIDYFMVPSYRTIGFSVKVKF